MLYALLAFHVVLIAIARRMWRRRGLEWTTFDTATCVVVPFALFLLWILVSALIPSAWWPSAWSEQTARVLGLGVVTLPPLTVFWVCFFCLGLKRQTVSPDQDHARLSAVKGSSSRSWAVWRQDDSGNRFLIETNLTEEQARALVADFESKGHKQTYWCGNERNA
jgi:hypothetical protein